MTDLDTIIGSLFIFGFEGTSLNKDNPCWHWLEQGLSGVTFSDNDYASQNISSNKRCNNIASPEQLSALTKTVATLNPNAFRSVAIEGGDNIDQKKANSKKRV